MEESVAFIVFILDVVRRRNYMSRVGRRTGLRDQLRDGDL